MRNYVSRLDETKARTISNRRPGRGRRAATDYDRAASQAERQQLFLFRVVQTAVRVLLGCLQVSHGIAVGAQFC